MPKPWIVPVGGFLGAGKTTLIIAAARVLQQRGVGVAAILNDQGSELVDMAYVLSQNVPASEVKGGCFCCRFSDLLDAIEKLSCFSPDVIFIEPVGSCTDLVATVLRPLRQDFLDRYRLAPLTVLVDPARMRSNPGFLFDHQLAEADLIAFTKSDVYDECPALNHPEVRKLSAASGQGVNEWLNEMLSGTIAVGTAILDINYEEYAHAEAALGWLNWSGRVELEKPLSPAQLIGPLMDDVQRSLRDAAVQTAHLKIFDQAAGSYLKVAVTDSDHEPRTEGDLTASPENEHHVRVNLRALCPALELASLFGRELERVPGLIKDAFLECFSPAAPKPERRAVKAHEIAAIL